MEYVTRKKEQKNRIKRAIAAYKEKELPAFPPEKSPDMNDEKYNIIWENWFWADFCDFCKSCRRDCKQSWQVTIMNCTTYNPISKIKEQTT